MKRKVLAVVLCVTLLSSLLSCGSLTWEENKGAAVGAGAGAATGAIAGALIGGDTEGAIIGGLLGALAGGVIGHYAYDQQRTRDQTAEEYQYDETRGRILTMEDVAATPQTIRKGDTVNLNMTYAVLSPSHNAITRVTETREITYNGALVGNPTVRVDRYDGTYTSTVPLRLPADAKTGLYLVKSTVQSEYGSDAMESSFTVRY